MKFINKRTFTIILCSLLIADLAVSFERKANRREKWWPFGGGNKQDNSSPNAELYRRMAMGVLQVMYNTGDNDLHKCIPLAGEWGKLLDSYKQHIDYWPTKVGPLVDIILRFGGGFILDMVCSFRKKVLKLLQPWFNRRMMFLEGKFSSERNRFKKVFRRCKV